MGYTILNKLRKQSGVLYILPSAILIFTFSLIPLFMTGYYSFHNYNVIQPAQWIGLTNFANLMDDVLFKASLINTIVYTIIVVPVQTILAVILANIIASYFRDRFGNFIKGALFIPVVSSLILVGTIWKFLLATDSGIVNNFLSLFGVDGLNWLGTKTLSMISISLASIWKNVGYFLVIYYAGIMDIPRSYYEAADVDGATGLQKFRYITLPSLKPITYLVITLGTIWSFQVFDLVYAMTGGGPGHSTSTLVLSIYQYGFKYYKMGYASAISVVLFLIILLVSLFQRRLFSEEKF